MTSYDSDQISQALTQMAAEAKRANTIAERAVELAVTANDIAAVALSGKQQADLEALRTLRSQRHVTQP